MKGSEYTFPKKRGYTRGQQTHEKMLNFISHQGDANPSHNEIQHHTK